MSPQSQALDNINSIKPTIRKIFQWSREHNNDRSMMEAGKEQQYGNVCVGRLLYDLMY
jgi:hypothetical protein